MFPKGLAHRNLRRSYTKDDTFTTNEHTFPLRNTPHGSTNTTAFAATIAGTSSDVTVEGGVTESGKWKYGMMDDEEAGRETEEDSHNIRVESQWEVHSHKRPPGV